MYAVLLAEVLLIRQMNTLDQRNMFATAGRSLYTLYEAQLR